MRTAAWIVLGLAVATSACESTPQALPAGMGLIACDTPDNTAGEKLAAPAWKVGDTFSYLRGGSLKIQLHVDAADEHEYRLLDETTGLVTVLTNEFASRGQESKAKAAPSLTFDPADYDLSWPLWVGKHWTAHFVSRVHKRDDLPWIATYHCDAIETVTVPAGKFRCWRVWRRARVAIEGEFLERTSVSWYSPDVGNFVRRLADGMLTELTEFHRAP